METEEKSLDLDSRIPFSPCVLVWAARAYLTASLCLKHLNGSMTTEICYSQSVFL